MLAARTEQALISGDVPELQSRRMPIRGQVRPLQHAQNDTIANSFLSINTPHFGSFPGTERLHKLLQMNSFPSESNGATDNDATDNEDKLVAILWVCI